LANESPSDEVEANTSPRTFSSKEVLQIALGCFMVGVIVATLAWAGVKTDHSSRVMVELRDALRHGDARGDMPEFHSMAQMAQWLADKRLVFGAARNDVRDEWRAPFLLLRAYQGDSLVRYDIVSRGRDGKLGTKDDVSVAYWLSPRPDAAQGRAPAAD